MRLKGKAVKRGKARGKALVSEEPISFLGGVDPDSGKISEPGHPLKGESVEGRVLVFPHGKGSTVGSYILYQLARNGKAPAAIINKDAEPIVAVGAIIADLPMIHRLDQDPIKSIENGDIVIIEGEIVEVMKK